jgi:hypothetical protein
MGPRGDGSQEATGDSGSRRLSKSQRRILTILKGVQPAREQLIAAMEDISSTFDLDTLSTAAESPDPRERNKVSAVERQSEMLINWMNELGLRILDEGLRIGALTVKGSGSPWQRLADLGVITQPSAERLREAKDTRNGLGHAYPPESWRALHAAVNIVLAELDGYIAHLHAWAVQENVLPPATKHTQK